MDDFYPYDETFEEFERRTGLDKFFGEFSSEVRNKLLSKNLEKPKDVYDVLYPNTRENLKSKNVSKKIDLEENSEEIRNSLISKHVEKQSELEESGELSRKSLLSKNKLIKSSIGLEEIGEESRKSAVAKNKFYQKTIEQISNEARRSNSSKNSKKDNDLLSKSELERLENMSRNVSSENTDLDSPEYRKSNVSKNENKKSDLEAQSSSFRRQMLSQNSSSKASEEDTESLFQRNNQLSRNVVNESNLEIDSESIRKDNVNKNGSKITNVEDVASDARPENLSKNYSRETDLESQSNSIREDSLSKNDKTLNDLEAESNVYREDSLSKNSSKTTNLESDGNVYREDSLSKNELKTTDLENISSINREDNVSKNNSSNTDLESDSEPYRQEDISRNKSKITDLESISSEFRSDDLKSNTKNNSDLESYSSPFRNDDLSYNSPINSDLEADSSPFRDDDLSYNSPINSDLESDSTPFRDDDLSYNSPINSDLEDDSIPFRNDDLSYNSPINSDLEDDSVPFRNDDLSVNVPINSDLEDDSVPFRNDDLSVNVPINSDLETDSISTLSDNLAHNVPNFTDLQADSTQFRDDDLSANVSNNFDLGLESIQYRNDDLATNVPSDNDLIGESKQERDEQLAHNVSISPDLGNLSSVFRNEQLSKNPTRFSLGANINLVNTSFFVGVSNLEIQGAIFREANKVLNRSRDKDSLPNVFDDDESIAFFEELASNNPRPGGREHLMAKNLNSSLKLIEGNKNIIGTYSTRLTDDTGKIDNGITLFSRPEIEGDITDLIALHNIQQNTFQSRPGYQYEPGNQSALDDLKSFGSDGFQKLLSLNAVDKRLQRRTNTTPAEIISENDGKYLGADAEKMLKPGANDEPLGTGVSMAGQINPTDTISKDFDRNGFRARGVRHVIDTIKKDDRIAFAQNFDVQGQREVPSIFITGNQKGGNGYTKSYNRFSIKNPYAPEGAQSMQFSLTNYSIGFSKQRTMALPPYIKSFQHGDSANWNSVSFLGRPEPIYTYSDSSRDGSITFVVLTDYAQEVDLGYEFDPDNGTVEKIVESFNGVSHLKDSSRNSQVKDLDAKIKKIEEEIKEKWQEADQKGGRFLPNANTFETEKRKEINKLKEQRDGLNASDIQASQYERFYETTNGEENGTNIYKFMEGFQENELDGEYIESKPENTVAKLAEMKNNLMFQPAYFSGSKNDFLERMEFIAKLTRPARNTNISDGFSFTVPPVCHLHLGDWFNHDIIVNSVSYDYADVPWTTDGNNDVFDGGGNQGGTRVQPMWCNVTVNFNIIGAYKAYRNEDPPLSTDRGGFFSKRVSN